MAGALGLTMMARAITVGMFIFIVLGCFALGFGFDWLSLVRLIIPLAILIAASTLYTVFRPEPRLAALSTAMADLLLFSAVGVQFTYIVAAMGGPLWDDQLFAFDMALGLDWLAYLSLANQYPWIAFIGKLAYQSLQIQIIIVVAVLGLSGQIVRLRGFIAAMAISGLATGILSGIMPAVDAFVHLNPPSDAYSNLNPSAGFIHLQDFTELRDGSLRTLSINRAEGIITFPSFHTTLGVIFTWAMWSVPWARWPISILNVALIAATPIDGGHYFADLFGGALLAALSILAVNAVARRSEARERSILANAHLAPKQLEPVMNRAAC